MVWFCRSFAMIPTRSFCQVTTQEQVVGEEDKVGEEKKLDFALSRGVSRDYIMH